MSTQRTTRLREWIRIQFLSPYIKNIPKDEKTLDLGCGWGFSFKINPNFYGVEADEACLAYCKKCQYNVIRADLLDPLPFPDNFFDNCFSHDVLEHFELKDVKTIFRNVHKVLRKGGTFINIIPNRLGFELGLRTNAGHRHFITPEEVEEMSRITGFTFLKSYSSPFPAFFHRFLCHNKYVNVCKK